MQTVWKNRNFRLLIGGQTISEFGSAITVFAIPWLMLQLTGSALQVGLSFAVGFTPYLLLSLPAGVWADRFDRKKLMMIADVGRMLLIVSIPLAHAFGHLMIWQLYLIQAGMSAFNALFDTAYVACLPSVVGKRHLQEANAALQSGVSASQILGPALAGSLVAFIGAANTIVIDGISYAISVTSLVLIRHSFSTSKPRDASSGIWTQIRAGLAFVWHHRLIRTISFLTMVLNIGGSAIMAVLMYHVEHDLHVSAAYTGIIMTGYSVGTVSGSLLSAFLGRYFKMGFLMSTSIVLIALPSFLLALSPWPWLIMAANFLVGFAAVVWNVQSVSLRQSVIPDELLGRASSAIRMIAWASMPLGAAIGGTVGQASGATVVFLGAGVLQMFVWVWGLTSPLYRVKDVSDADRLSAMP